MAFAPRHHLRHGIAAPRPLVQFEIGLGDEQLLQLVGLVRRGGGTGEQVRQCQQRDAENGAN
jgi:hypothetical protein